MKVEEYMVKNRLSIVEFACLTKVSVPTVYRLLADDKMHYSTALKIEQGTKGEVKIEDIRHARTAD